MRYHAMQSRGSGALTVFLGIKAATRQLADPSIKNILPTIEKTQQELLSQADIIIFSDKVINAEEDVLKFIADGEHLTQLEGEIKNWKGYLAYFSKEADYHELSELQNKINEAIKIVNKLESHLYPVDLKILFKNYDNLLANIKSCESAFDKATDSYETFKYLIFQVADNDDLLRKLNSIEAEKFGDFALDYYNSKSLRTLFENNADLVESWKAIKYCGDDELAKLATNLDELEVVAKNINDINLAGGYKAWKLAKGAGKFDTYIKNGFRLDASTIDDAFVHLDNVTLNGAGKPTFNNSNGLLGCHNELNFNAQKFSNGGRIEVISEVPSNINGVKTVQYKVLQADIHGNLFQVNTQVMALFIQKPYMIPLFILRQQ